MALDDLGLEIDFPTLLVSGYWVEAHCIVSDGFEKGQWFGLIEWQAWGLLNFYRLRPDARVGQLAPAFVYRRSQIVLPQKGGKAPYTSAHICLEGVGPALFAGWAKGGEVWDCRDHGCGCGWVYEYQAGEAMGMPWPTPLIQITATSEDQTDNIYSALRPMIDDGPLSVMIPKTGEEFIRLPNKGRIDVVTSNAKSRLGQRVTYVPQDETGIWTVADGMIKVAETQRRGLAGMGGRAEETTNAWDPTENSVAQRTAEAATGDIFRLHPLPPDGLVYKKKADRRKIHKHVYQGCRWIDLDAIEAEAAELIAVDPGQAERFFGNRPTAGSDAAFDIDAFRRNQKPKMSVVRHELITIGVDGARFHDAIAAIATHVKSGYQWPLVIIERPNDAGDDYEHPVRELDEAIIEAFDLWSVWRAYCDPHHIEHVIEGWQNRYGDKVVVPWYTYRPRQIAWAVRNYEEAISNGDMSHSGDELFERHVAHARKKALTIKDDHERFMHTLSKDSLHSPRKIDAAMAAVLSWEARGDAIAAGAVSMTAGNMPMPPGNRDPKFRPGFATPASLLHREPEYGPMGSLS